MKITIIEKTILRKSVRRRFENLAQKTAITICILILAGACSLLASFQLLISICKEIVMKGKTLSESQAVYSRRNFISKTTTFLSMHLISLLLTLVILTANASVVAQSILDSGTPIGVAPGAPAGSYALSDIENINLFNGNLNFALPLQKIRGRGEAGSQIILPIESHWTNFYFFRQPDGSYYNPSPWHNGNLGASSTSDYGPGVMAITKRQIEISLCGSNRTYQTQIRLTFTAPGGTHFELQDTAYQGAVLTYGGCAAVPPPSFGTTFVTADGTSATFVSDTVIDTYTSSRPFGRFMMRDGTQYRIDDGLVSWILDRNGNKTTYTYANRRLIAAKDSIGRETTFEYSVNDVAPYGLCDRIIFKGGSGQQRIIRVSYDSLSNTLAAGYTLRPKYQLFPPVNPAFDLPNLDKTTPFDTEIISSVWLPDDGIVNRRYKFFYNSYAELARAELPTGAAYEYDWETAPEMAYESNYPEIIRRVKERRVVIGGAVERKTTYSYTWAFYGAGDSVVTVDHFSGSQRISKQKHFFHGTPVPLTFSFTRTDLYDGSAWSQGKEYQTDLFAADGVTLLRTTSQTWRQRAPVNWWTCGSYCTTANAPANDPRVVETITTLADTNQVSKVTSIDPTDSSGQTVGFDQFNNPTDTWEYDYNVGQPGNFKRRIHTDYVTDPNYISQTGSHLRGMPLQTWVSPDINGTNKDSITEFKYDETALTPRNNVIGWVSQTNPYRGNLTKKRNWVKFGNEPETWLETKVEYDVLGNVVKTIDAKNYISTINYDDNFGLPDNEARTNSAPTQLNGQSTFAFPTSMTNPLLWTAYAQFDYFTGKPVNTEDIDGVISKTLYNDVLDRPTQAVTAVGITNYERQTSIVYDDANRRVQTTSDLNALNDNRIKAESFYDGLGRTVESHSYESDGTFVVTKTVPFLTVQDPETSVWRAATKTSNPYRPSLGEQPVWTTSLTDSLGRGTKVITPDGAVAKTEYSGNAVTVTDQASKQRRSVTNALGQLTRVDEPDVNNSLGTIEAPAQPTVYAYDTLNNLKTVTQTGTTLAQCGGTVSNCTQTRSFVYDSLSRLKSATNPESGFIQYSYDANGNLITKTDARGVVTTYGGYDALNRMAARNYTAPANLPNYQAAPDVAYTYDDVNTPYSKGKLTKVSSIVSTTENTQFDILGRVRSNKQTTDGTAYTTAYSYNLSGALISETYPSGRVVKNVLDNIGNLSIVQSKKTSTAGYWNYAQHFSYTAAGGVSSMQLGNGKWESTTFNSRLQPTQIALGAVQNGTDNLKLNYTYNTPNVADNNGNVKTQTITVPSIGTTAAFVATQNYTYDSLNRLKQATETIPNQTGWKQTFIYDRFGNRSFDESGASGSYATTTLNRGCPASGYNPNGICDKKSVNPTIAAGNNRIILDQEGDSVNDYLFDAAGNTTQDANGKTFTYDGENKQTKVTSGSSVMGEYSYDGDGKRVKKYVPSTGETTIFVYDASGKMVAEYSTVVASTADAKVSYLTNDSLGSLRITTDANGIATSRRDFMPFGEEIAATGLRAGYGSDTVRQKFTSYERDNESELDFGQARYYSSKLGRFYSADPENAGASEDDPQSWNGYAYSRNNPTLLVDPDGRKYTYCDSNGVCVDYGDDEFHKYIHNLPDGYERVKGEDGAGVIKFKGEVVATYTRPYVDFGSEQASMAINGIVERAPATQRVVTTMAAISATIVVAPVVADMVGTLLAEHLASRLFQGTVERTMGNPIILSHIFKSKHLLEPLVRQLGSQRAVVTAVITALKGIELSEGKQEVMVKVGSTFVNVQVFVQNGVAKINDFWVPK